MMLRTGASMVARPFGAAATTSAFRGFARNGPGPKKNVWNRSQGYDWTSVQREVFGVADAQPKSGKVEPGIPQERRATYIPPAHVDEKLEGEPERMPLLDSLSDNLNEQRPRRNFIQPTLRPKLVDDKGRSQGSGARKTANAWCVIAPGSGKLTINGHDLPYYFPDPAARDLVLEPLAITETFLMYDVSVQVKGSGKSAQAGAVRMAIAKALQNRNPQYRWTLKIAGCLKRDPRRVERKKTGKPKARKSRQWSKR